MPLPNLAVPQFPIIPDAPGVPPILRGAPNINLPIPLALTSDGAAIDASQTSPKWGIFDSGGNAVIVPDAVAAFDFSQEFRISDYPIEGGQFQSYNKVDVPFEARVTFLKGGADSDRTTFLNSIDDAIRSLDLLTVVTPEVSYANANITHYDYRRTSSAGATLLTVEVWTQEVRVAAEAAFANTTDPTGDDKGAAKIAKAPKSPGGASPVNDGAVQASVLTPSQGQAVSAGVGIGVGGP